MKTNQKLPMADGRLLIKAQRTVGFPGSIVNRKSPIVNVRAFTLIELLTVIAIIGIIAALIFPVARTVNRQVIIHSAQAQMAKLETALERYKSVYGFYPPASARALTNQLYYELEGMTNIAPPNLPPVYQPLGDASQQLTSAQVNLAFGTSGFMNCNKPGSDEAAAHAANFLTELNTNEFSAVSANGVTVNLLVTSVGGPTPVGQTDANPWRYSYPGTNNPGSYDLWVQLVIAGKTNLVCNWTKTVEINNNTLP